MIGNLEASDFWFFMCAALCIALCVGIMVWAVPQFKSGHRGHRPRHMKED